MRFGRKRCSCGEILSTITNNREKTDVTGKQGKCLTLDSFRLERSFFETTMFVCVWAKNPLVPGPLGDTKIAC